MKTSLKLALAGLAAAALAPMSSLAAPAFTTVEQVNTSVEASFGNTFSQTVGVTGATAAPVAAGQVVATGAGVTNAADYTLATDLSNLTASTSVVGGAAVSITAPATITASMGTNAGVGVLSIAPTALAGEGVSVSTTVFGVSGIKASQSVVESTSMSMF